MLAATYLNLLRKPCCQRTALAVPGLTLEEVVRAPKEALVLRASIIVQLAWLRVWMSQ